MSPPASKIAHGRPFLQLIQTQSVKDGFGGQLPTAHDREWLEVTLPSLCHKYSATGNPPTLYQLNTDVLPEIESAIRHRWPEVRRTHGDADSAPPPHSSPSGQDALDQPDDVFHATGLSSDLLAVEWKRNMVDWLRTGRVVCRPSEFAGYPPTGRGLSTIIEFDDHTRLPVHLFFCPPLSKAGTGETFKLCRLPRQQSDGTDSLVSISWTGPDELLTLNVSGSIGIWGSSLGYIEGSSQQIGTGFEDEEAQELFECINVALAHWEIEYPSAYDCFWDTKTNVRADLLRLCTKVVDAHTQNFDTHLHGRSNTDKTERHVEIIDGPDFRTSGVIEVCF